MANGKTGRLDKKSPLDMGRLSPAGSAVACGRQRGIGMPAHSGMDQLGLHRPLGALWLFFAVFFLPVMHKRFSYRMTGDRLEVHTGVIYTHHKAMPVSSVKYLSTFDGPFERLCGLTNLMVFAAGSFVVLAGLTKEQEAELRRRLLKNG